MPFEGYEYPYIRKELREQIFKSVLFISAPSKSILGFTFKNLGVILINKGRNKNNRQEEDKSRKYVLGLEEFSIYKLIFLHETYFHYFFVIFFFK